MNPSLRFTPALALVVAATPGAQSLVWSATGSNPSEQVGTALAFGSTVTFGPPPSAVLFVGAPLAQDAGFASGRVDVYRAGWSLTQKVTTIPGTGPIGQFGAALSTSGDLDGDGTVDLVVGAPGDARVFAYSGADLTQLPFSPILGSAQTGFGRAVAIVDDLDADGLDDIAVGAPFTALGSESQVGAVHFYSSSNGSLLSTTLDVAWQAGACFGASLARLGDLDLDGSDELGVGAPMQDEGAVQLVGRAVALSLVEGTFLYEFGGSAEREFYGSSIADAGDVNGDGRSDWIVGGPGAGVSAAGRVEVRSGKNGAALFTALGGPGYELGVAVVGAGDVDHDGYADFLAGSPGARSGDGQAFLWSGRTGDVLYEPAGKKGSEERFGAALAGRGSADFDVYDDWAVGRPNSDAGGASDAGGITVYRGKLSGTLTGGLGFGHQVDALGDVNGDGIDDYIVARQELVPVAPQAGWAVVSGKDETQIFGGAVTSCGRVAVAGIDDVDGDGAPDFLVGNPCASQVRLHSSATGAFLHTYSGAPGEDFGYSVCSAGDVDGDGVSDVAIGAPGAEFLLFDDWGRVDVYSGAFPFALLWSRGGLQADARFGHALAGVGLFDGDARPDVAVGAPYFESGAVEVGRVQILSGVDGLPILDRLGTGVISASRLGWSLDAAGDVNADGFADLLVGEPDYSVPGGAGAVGRVHVYTGPFGQETLDVVGSEENARLGHAVAGPGDVDGDGRDDLAASSPGAAVLGVVGSGRVEIFSGATTAVIDGSLGPPGTDTAYGYALGARPTAGVDGVHDLIAGAPFDSHHGSSGFAQVEHLPSIQLAHVGVSGCGAAPSLQLDVGGPYLGELLELTVTGSPIATAFVMVALPPAVVLPLGDGCNLYVDILGVLATLPVSTVAGSGATSVLVPDKPALLGFDLAAQALAVVPGVGFGLSDGAYFSIGF